MDPLAALRPVSQAYATLPVEHAFDWSDAAVALPMGEWYMVAFRSIRRHGADEERLTFYDDLAHREAEGAPGFVSYFKGPVDVDGTCLSFCLWDSRAEARAAAGRPDHLEAVSLIGEMYEAYTLEFLRVRRTSADAPLQFEPYDPLPTPPEGFAPPVAIDFNHGALAT
jgi:hypothetical protein